VLLILQFVTGSHMDAYECTLQYQALIHRGMWKTLTLRLEARHNLSGEEAELAVHRDLSLYVWAAIDCHRGSGFTYRYLWPRHLLTYTNIQMYNTSIFILYALFRKHY